VTGGLFAFPVDILDEGVDKVLDNVQHRAGLDGIALAAVYHDARDVLPHSPQRAVYYHHPGAVAFHPNMRLYDGMAIQPILSETARDIDVVNLVQNAADRRGIRVDAWVNLLHCDRGREVVDYTTRNAFGDPSLSDLCPANPQARAYVCSLLADLASRGVPSIIAEGLHYYPFDHGYHHERSFVAIDAWTKLLLGLCFCESCRQLAEAEGVDVSGLLLFVREEIRAGLGKGASSPDRTPSRAELQECAGGMMGAYLATRSRVVTALVEEAAAAVHDSANAAQLLFMDPCGAIKGYATGRPEGELAVEIGWMLGVEIADVVRHCDGLHTMSYGADPERIRAEFAAYRSALGPAAAIGTVLRPTPPDCSSAGELAVKVDLLDAMDATRIDFYNYGLMPLEALDWIRAACSQGRRR
jgi:hypothetical protein